MIESLLDRQAMIHRLSSPLLAGLHFLNFHAKISVEIATTSDSSFPTFVQLDLPIHHNFVCDCSLYTHSFEPTPTRERLRKPTTAGPTHLRSKKSQNRCPVCLESAMCVNYTLRPRFCAVTAIFYSQHPSLKWPPKGNAACLVCFPFSVFISHPPTLLKTHAHTHVGCLFITQVYKRVSRILQITSKGWQSALLSLFALFLDWKTHFCTSVPGQSVSQSANAQDSFVACDVVTRRCPHSLIFSHFFLCLSAILLMRVGSLLSLIRIVCVCVEQDKT